MRVRTRISVMATIGALALVGACDQSSPEPEPTSQSTTDRPSPTTTEPAEPTSTTTEPTEEPSSDELPFPDSVEEQVGEPAGEPDLVLIDVQVAEFPGYDRLVVEFTGTGTPGWTVGYVDAAVEGGSGQTIALEGESVLNVVASNSTYPPSQDAYYSGPKQFDPEQTDTIEEVYVAGVFEGQTQVILGIDEGAKPFRVFTLADPARLVVDVQTLPG
ncbi:MAG: hypothetical protein ACK5H2_07915 [Beutenbergiaceae bacterium]